MLQPASRPLMVLTSYLLFSCPAVASPAAAIEPSRRPSADVPQTLHETGLYDGPGRTVTASAVEYEPRFPLWSDGLLKRRWIQLPTGAAIDASDISDWHFPTGTKIWKEFALPDHPVETRYMERTEDGWLYATYLWDAAGSAAALAPARGARGVAELAPGIRHDVPGRFDCTVCHEAQAQAVLGFSAVQLAAGRSTPDLPSLVEQGVIVNVQPRLLEIQPKSNNRRAEAALGYLHANCGHCHNTEGALAPLGLDLRLDPLLTTFDQTSPGVVTTLGLQATATAHSASAPMRVVPGEPDASQLLQRMATRDPLAQMPPLGTHLVDRTAVDLLVAWIRQDLLPQQSSVDRLENSM